MSYLFLILVVRIFQFHRWSCIPLICCILVFALPAPIVSGADKYQDKIILSAGPWAPFTGEKLTGYGSAAKKVSNVFSRAGIKVEYVFYPWKRAFIEAREGRVDGGILWRKTKKREESFYYSAPVLKADIVFFHLKKNPFDWNSIDSLIHSDVKVGVVRGFEYENNFDREVTKNRIKRVWVTTQKQSLAMLLLNRIEITPIVKESGIFTINQFFPADKAALFTYHPKILARHNLHLIMSKRRGKSQECIELFNQALKQME